MYKWRTIYCKFYGVCFRRGPSLNLTADHRRNGQKPKVRRRERSLRRRSSVVRVQRKLRKNRRKDPSWKRRNPQRNRRRKKLSLKRNRNRKRSNRSHNPRLKNRHHLQKTARKLGKKSQNKSLTETRNSCSQWPPTCSDTETCSSDIPLFFWKKFKLLFVQNWGLRGMSDFKRIMCVKWKPWTVKIY